MPSKELTHEELKAIVAAKMADPNTMAADILSIILDALKEPTEGMIDAYFNRCRELGFTSHVNATAAWSALLAASALGEQSE